MVNFDVISIVVFYTLLFLFFLKFRERFTIQAKIFALYKTKLGLKLMDKIAKIFPRFQRFLASIGVLVGFSGMIFIMYFLVVETAKLILIPGTPPALAPVLPGIEIPGAPTLSFWHWVITIFVAAVIHEFSHGVVARLHNIPVKSSGFAFLGPILAAFVEPEEATMVKRKHFQQMSVFAAGPFSNIITGFLILLLITFVIAPFAANMYQGEGIQVSSLIEDYPMADTDIVTPFLVTAINGEETLDVFQFTSVMSDIKPGDELTLTTDKGDYTIITSANKDDETIAFIGIGGLSQKTSLKAEYAGRETYANIVQWFQLLFTWLFIISIGIGLFNLLPLGPVDGGRMFYSLALVVFKKKSRADRALNYVSLFVLGLIIINMIPWLNKFVTWIGSGIVFLLALLL